MLLVLCSCPSEEAAESLGRLLVESRLAACVSLMPGVRSLYSWKGRMEQAQESLLLIKTTEQAYPKLEAAITKNHPYEVPEIIALPVQDGSAEYLNWVQENTCTD